MYNIYFYYYNYLQNNLIQLISTYVKNCKMLDINKYFYYKRTKKSLKTEFCDTRIRGVLSKSRWLNFHELCKTLGILNFRKFFETQSIPVCAYRNGRGWLERRGESVWRSGSWTSGREGSRKRRKRVGNNQEGETTRRRRRCLQEREEVVFCVVGRLFLPWDAIVISPEECVPWEPGTSWKNQTHTSK